MSTQTSTAVTTHEGPSAADLSIMEQVIIKGDLSSLTAEQRAEYYLAVCKSCGLNPLTKPFDYIVLKGKMTLYALKTTTDQLRKLNGVSITRIERELVDDVLTVTAWAQAADGRADLDVGVVSMAGLRGEDKANAVMKALTKAKRRVTLSICGLGWLDESEVDSIPNARHVTVDTATGEILDGAATTTKAQPPITIVSGSSAEVAAVATEAEHRPAPPAPPADDRPLTMTQAKRLEESLAQAGWQVADVRRAAQDLFGKPLVRLTAAEARAFHAAASDGMIQYDKLTSTYTYEVEKVVAEGGIVLDAMSKRYAYADLEDVNDAATAAKAEAALPL